MNRNLLIKKLEDVKNIHATHTSAFDEFKYNETLY